MSAAAPGLPGPGSSPSPAQERRAGWERKRCRGAEALLRTEGKYLEQLEGVATYFVVILKAKGILKPEVHEALFGSWESICSASRTLLFHLARGHFALGLEGFCQQLVLYVHHAENLGQAQDTLEKLVRKNRAFSRFKKLQESRPELKGRRLEELLPLPLQRLHQYRHLLQDLVERSGFDQLQGALASVSEVLHRVQEIACARENVEMVRQVQKRLKGQKTQVLAPGSHKWMGGDEGVSRRRKVLLSQERLQLMHKLKPDKGSPGRSLHLLLRVQEDLKVMELPPRRQCLPIQRRWYLQEGWLTVVPSKGKEMQRRMFFLFSDILLLTKPCHPLHPWNSHRFACQAVFPLSHCAVEKVFGHTQSRGGLLSLSFPQRKLLLMSCDQEDCDKWHQNLVAAIRELQVSAGPPSQKAE